MPNSPERLVRTMWGPAVEQRHDVDAGRRHNVAWLWRWFARTSQKFLGDLSGAFWGRLGLVLSGPFVLAIPTLYVGGSCLSGLAAWRLSWRGAPPQLVHLILPLPSPSPFVFSLLFHLLSLKRIWPLCLESWSCR